MYAHKVLAALAVVGFASAKAATSTSSQCSQPTATIASQADAESLMSCTTFTGDIVVDGSTAATLEFDGIQQIEGSFIVNNATFLNSLSAPVMNSISGTMMLNGLTVLSTLSFPDLKSIGTINWITLPLLTSLTFTSVVSKCNSLTIEDTLLGSLDGINLDTVNDMTINNNRFLTTISTQVANITSSVDIDSNGQGLAIEFPNLIWAGNMTFRNATTVSIPSLASINDTLAFIGNVIESIMAPNLTSVGSILTFEQNSNLNNITMNSLSKVGGLKIDNNDKLIKLTGFEGLKNVAGAFNITGNYDDAEFPSLARVGGAFFMTSTGNFSCTAFDKLQSEGETLATYRCAPTDAKSGTSGDTGTSGTSTGSSSSPTTSKKGDAGHVTAPVALGLIGGFLALLL